MNKTIFEEYLTNELNLKKGLLAENSISEEDKKTVQNQIDNLQGILDRVAEMEDAEVSKEVVDGLLETVNSLSDQLKAIAEKIELQKENNNEDSKEENKMNYLETKNSVKDFCAAIRASRNANEFRNNWKEYLVANSIEFDEGAEDAYLPIAVRGQIQDLWEKGAGFLADLTNTNAKKFAVRWNMSDKDDETSRAKGHKRGDTKVSQELLFGKKEIEAMFVYKLQELTTEDVWENDADMLNYILQELVNQILAEVRRAILVGDGRQDGSDYKITSFESIGKQTSDAFTTVITASADFLIDDAIKVVDAIENPLGKPIYMVMSKQDLRSLTRISASETSSPVYIDKAQLADMLGVSQIITSDYVGSDKDYQMLAFIPSEYYLVGEGVTNPAYMTDHDIRTNTNIYRMEVATGGGINGLKSTSCLLPA